jgi:ubiquinone/menaquinone biosynthesis C-methylase UbiE
MPTNPNPSCEGSRRTGDRMTPGWVPFARHTAQYDAWFDSGEGRRIFDVETACIRSLLADSPRPWLEVGVGTGRFAEALRIDEGLDPCPAVLRYAERRGIRTRCGSAENLPYADGSFGTVMLIVTLCFLDDPVRAFAECRRVLKEHGKVLVGLVPKDSPWGKAYARQGAEGHPFYSAARFYTTREIVELARRAGFDLEHAASCLPETPGQTVDTHRAARDGIVKNAGFVALRFGGNKKNRAVGRTAPKPGRTR